jgi:hypothetical protein
MMGREFNSLSRQNRILGIITALRFENVLATNQNDLGRTLYALTTKLENYSQMIPKEYRHESRMKTFYTMRASGKSGHQTFLAELRPSPHGRTIQCADI